MVAKDALLDGGAGFHLFVVGLLVAASSLEEVVKGRHDADADRVVVLGDIPPPALPVGGLDNKGGALVASAVAIGALPVGPDGPFVKDRIPEP